MKFARYLEENAVVEWRRAYINYRGLKKLIKRVDARYKARSDLTFDRQTSQGASSLRTISALRKRKQSKPNRGDDEHSDTTASDAALFDEAAREAAQVNLQPQRQRVPSSATKKLPSVSLDGTGLALSWQEEPGVSSMESSQDTSPSNPTIRSGSTTAQESLENSKDVEAQASAAKPPTRHASQSFPERPAAKTSTSNTSVFSALKKATDSKDIPEHHKKGKKHGKHAAAKGYETILFGEFDGEERKFFSALDNELERIVSFYLTHERDMTKRYEMLARQLQELAEHRKEYKAKHPHPGSRSFGDRFSHFVKLPHPAASIPRVSSQLHRETGGKSGKDPDNSETLAKGADKKQSEEDSTFDEGDQRRADAIAKMLNITGGTLTDREDEQIRKRNLAAAMSHNSEHYRSARKQLKDAVLEYYRGLEILKNYKVLNRTGFVKILKKFEKTTGVHISDAYYHAKVASSVLVNSDVIERLLKSTEETYTAYFEHGNRKRALERLRINANTSPGGEHYVSHYASVTRTGFYLGIALCAIVGGIVNAYDPVKRAGIPLWEELLRVYGFEFIPTLFALLFGVCLIILHHVRVNVVFIFEWDVRHALDYHQYFEMPAFFMMLLGLAFWVSFLNPFPDAIAPTTWPLVWLVAVLTILLNPLPIFHYHSRRWLITSLGRVMHGGVLDGVQFRDFFLGDILTSMVWPLSMLWYFGCEYEHHWAVPNRCDPNRTFFTGVLLTLPATWRLLQCFRRYYNSGYTANLHMVNAAKYAATALNYWFYFNYRFHGSQRPKDVALWCVFGTIYATYASLWDILMDWSLLQRHGKYPLLRKSLLYEDYWPVYYWAMVTNVILRFSWAIYLIPGPASNTMRIFVVALCEALRRSQWVLFRLENEQIGNQDMYRVEREVMLPYTMPKRKEEEDETDDEDHENGSWPILMHTIGRFSWQSKKSSLPPPGQNIQQGSESQQESTNGREMASSTGRGKQKARERDTGLTAPGGASSNDSSQDEAAQKRSSFLTWIENALVPDHGGMLASGSRLDDMGAAKGAFGRDYQPRRMHSSADSSASQSSSSDAEDDGEEEVDEQAAPTKLDESAPSRPSKS